MKRLGHDKKNFKLIFPIYNAQIEHYETNTYQRMYSYQTTQVPTAGKKFHVSTKVHALIYMNIAWVYHFHVQFNNETKKTVPERN